MKMNRVIKFRVRLKSSKEIIGYERINSQSHWEHQRLNRDGWLLGAITHEEELIREQFSGLPDKNGVEIYEGDIVKYNVVANWMPDNRATGVVSFNFGAFEIEKKKEVPTTSFYYPVHNFIRVNESNGTWGLEVIGNIYEHPHLLH